MIVEQNDYNLANEGEFEATLIDYEDLGERPDPFNPGETKHQIKLIWKLTGAGEQWDWVNASLFAGSSKFGPSKLYEIASLLLKANPPKKLDLDDLKGKSCSVSIKRYQDQQGKDRAKIDNYFIHSSKKLEEMSERISRPPDISEADIPF